MGLFGIKFKKGSADKNEPNITPEDKKWVDDCFAWLFRTFAYPATTSEPFLFNTKYFPITFQAKKIDTDNLLTDLCNLLSLNRDKISFTLVSDVRDISQTPYEIHGKAFESDLEVLPKATESTHYTIHIANSLISMEYLLLRRLILELVEIKLLETRPVLNSGKDLSYLSYIASIYFGFGVLLSKALVDVGVQYLAGWQKTWKNKSEVPYQVIAYALAAYAKVTKSESFEWKNELPTDVRNEFELAANYLLNTKNNALFNKELFENNIKARAFQDAGISLSKNKQFEQAIKAYEKGISLTTENQILANLYNNMAYAYLCLNDYSKSLTYYDKVLYMQPTNAYGLNNTGYIYILTDRLARAKECLDKVVPSNDILKAYLLRNWALFYLKSNDVKLASDYFKKAFDTGTPVDLLEYFYGQYLLSKLENTEALRYISISAAKGEKQGIELLDILKTGK